MRKHIFWIFGIVQSLTLAALIFVLFQSLNLIRAGVVGLDTMIVLSVLFPVFLLLTQYTIYSKK